MRVVTEVPAALVDLEALAVPKAALEALVVMRVVTKEVMVVVPAALAVTEAPEVLVGLAVTKAALEVPVVTTEVPVDLAAATEALEDMEAPEVTYVLFMI